MAFKSFKLALLTGAALGAFPAAALAQAAPASTPSSATATTQAPVEVGEIVVTAQKRSESINAVGMSINAMTGDTLQRRGIVDTADLVKTVPGFTYAPSAYSTPVYTLRGVGLYDSGFASSPAVSVYVDEIPLPYPVMTEGATLDVGRVEVLKGPQGTLFGQNSTGGAINYVPVKPTQEFAAGGSLTYERFGRVDASGYVSGPLSDTLTARVAVRAVEGGAWQHSLTRPNDELGADRQLAGRLLLDWRPNDRLKVSLNLNGWGDNSDTQAAQLMQVVPAHPALASPELLAAPIAPANARAADWTPGFPSRKHDSFYQGSLRGDYRFGNGLTLTSITAFAHENLDRYIDVDGTAIAALDNHTTGKIETFNQELRLSGDSGPLKWITGANYSHAIIRDLQAFYLPESTINQPLPFLPRFNYSDSSVKQRIETYAIFANADYSITKNLSVHAGIRYTDSRDRSVSCSFDPDPAQPLENVFTALQEILVGFGVKTTPVTPLSAGDCFTLSPPPQLAPGAFSQNLNEDNVSWRAGADYKLSGGALLYASISRGFKAGVISNINASTTTQFAPAKQERLDAYEVGFKAPFFDRTVHLDGAAFFYDYKNKQIRSRVLDPIFGLLETLVNVPQSQVWGLEADLAAHPITGLDLSVGATYLESKISKSFLTYNQEGDYGDFNGSPLPYTPKVQVNADAQYTWPIGGQNAFIGGGLTYHSVDTATFRTSALPASAFRINPYATLDLRAGIEAPDGNWRLSVFGKNITDKYYWTSVFQTVDNRVRYAARPMTYGVTFTIRTR